MNFKCRFLGVSKVLQSSKRVFVLKQLKPSRFFSTKVARYAGSLITKNRRQRPTQRMGYGLKKRSGTSKFHFNYMNVKAITNFWRLCRKDKSICVHVYKINCF